MGSALPSFIAMPQPIKAKDRSYRAVADWVAAEVSSKVVG